eukprot:TRINITY_DN3389_c5_g1_i1.p1 TRINITY_DN3389_c5_g1~~TRINITY_DN3389_c5_g1_i1.p1  ORF type:complete len:169 (-),score=34.11 TRINITY_DN3389_c5_g1_i1:12-470(-)
MATAVPRSGVEVLRVGIDPQGPCLLDAPLRAQISFRAPAPLQQAQWQLRFLADLVHHKLPVEMPLEVATSSAASCSTPPACGEGQLQYAELRAPHGVPSAALPASALESLGLLEARLVAEADGAELAAVRLVTDVRRNAAGQLERAVLEPFS